MLERIEAALREYQAGTAVDDRAMLVLRFTASRARRRPAHGRLTTILVDVFRTLPPEPGPAGR